MRRTLLVLMAVCLIGLTSAVASGFTANSEDVLVFGTEVSIPPPCTAEPIPTPFFVRGGASTTAVRTLDLVAPSGQDTPPPSMELVQTTIDLHLETTRYVAWRSAPAPACGWQIDGDAVLHIEQNRQNDDRMTAGLFACQPTAADPSTSCTQLAVVLGPFGTDNNESAADFDERIVTFAGVNAIVPPGYQLRLKIINRVNDQDPSVDNGNFHVQWGYRNQFKARLEFP